MRVPDSKFYVGINKTGKGDSWFVNQAMGKNTIGAIVKNMCQEAGIQGRNVNHSARKTAITTLVHAGIDNTLVQQHSGHKSLSSINNYSTASLKQQKKMSSVLSNFSKPTENTVSTLYAIPDDNDDDLLVRSSQQIVVVRSSQEIVEQTLGEIENYEHNLLDIRNQNMSTSIPKPPCSNIALQDICLNPHSNYIQQILSSAYINGNVIINYGNNNSCQTQEKENLSPKRKRPRVNFDSDSD